MDPIDDLIDALDAIAASRPDPIAAVRVAVPSGPEGAAWQARLQARLARDLHPAPDLEFHIQPGPMRLLRVEFARRLAASVPAGGGGPR